MTAKLNTTEHCLAVKVYWEDTDAGGIVYYANYLKYIERARSDLVATLGIDQTNLLEVDKILFAVKRCVLDYHFPAKLGDDLLVVTQLRKLAGASMELSQLVKRGDQLLVSAEVRLACIDLAGRPRRLPDLVRGKLTPFIFDGELNNDYGRANNRSNVA